MRLIEMIRVLKNQLNLTKTQKKNRKFGYIKNFRKDHPPILKSSLPD